MDYQLAQKIKNCFYYRGTPADAYKLVEDNLNSIDFDDDDDVSELFEILEYALTSKNDDDENSEEGADVNAVDNSRHSALYYASEAGFTAIVEQLLMAGAEN